MNAQQRAPARKRTFQTGTVEHKTLVRVEGFVAGGVKWARCINQKHMSDFVAGGYVESTYIPEMEWKSIQDDYIEVFMRDRD